LKNILAFPRICLLGSGCQAIIGSVSISVEFLAVSTSIQDPV